MSLNNFIFAKFRRGWKTPSILFPKSVRPKVTLTVQELAKIDELKSKDLVCGNVEVDGQLSTVTLLDEDHVAIFRLNLVKIDENVSELRHDMKNLLGFFTLAELEYTGNTENTQKLSEFINQHITTKNLFNIFCADPSKTHI